MTSRRDLPTRLRRRAVPRINRFIATGDRHALYPFGDPRRDEPGFDDGASRAAAARWRSRVLHDPATWVFLAETIATRLANVEADADLGPVHASLPGRVERAFAVTVAQTFIILAETITDDGMVEGPEASGLVAVDSPEGQWAFWFGSLSADMWEMGVIKQLILQKTLRHRLAIEGSRLHYATLKRDFRSQSRAAFRRLWTDLGVGRRRPTIGFRDLGPLSGVYLDVRWTGPVLFMNDVLTAQDILHLSHRPFGESPSMIDPCAVGALEAKSNFKTLGRPGLALLHETLHAVAARPFGQWREDDQWGLVIDYPGDLATTILRIEDFVEQIGQAGSRPENLAAAYMSPWWLLNEGWTATRTTALAPDYPYVSRGVLGLEGVIVTIDPKTSLVDHPYAAPMKVIQALFSLEEIRQGLLDGLADPQSEIIARLQGHLTTDRVLLMERWLPNEPLPITEMSAAAGELKSRGWDLVSEWLSTDDKVKVVA